MVKHRVGAMSEGGWAPRFGCYKTGIRFGENQGYSFIMFGENQGCFLIIFGENQGCSLIIFGENQGCSLIRFGEKMGWRNSLPRL